MSYDIIYRARFIKYDDDKIVPVIESGSNNCWETPFGGRERRAREWWYWKKTVSTSDEILQSIEAIRAEQIERNATREDHTYTDDSWSYYTALHIYGKRNTTYGEFYNFFKRAIKNAKTVEEWREIGVTFTARLNYAGEQKRKLGEIEDVNLRMKSSEDLRILENPLVYLTSYGEEPKKYRRFVGYVEQDHFFEIRTPEGGRFIKNSPVGYKYGLYGYGKRFRTESEAKKAARGREGFTIRRVEEAVKFPRYTRI